ncbi:MAG: hypothetical protein IJI24_07785, partial [Lachnospiraceae bacterium]|nr:hypothetical protein [Lachnospiraceae bacterium]
EASKDPKDTGTVQDVKVSEIPEDPEGKGKPGDPEGKGNPGDPEESEDSEESEEPDETEDPDESEEPDETENPDDQEDSEDLELESESEMEEMPLLRAAPVLRAGASYVGDLKTTIKIAKYYLYSTYNLGTYGTSKFLVTIKGIATKAYGFCANPAHDGPKTGTYRIETAADSFTKIMYYGLEEYSGNDCWFVAKGHSGYSSGKRYILIHLAVARNNNSSSLSQGATDTALKLANQLRKYALNMPNPPSPKLSLSSTSLKAYINGSEQRTANITLEGDTANQITMALPKGVGLVNVTKGTQTAAGGSATISGGDTFYLKAPLNQATAVGKTWNSPEMQGIISKAYAGYRVAASRTGALQDLLFLQVKDETASVKLSVTWVAPGNLAIKKTTAGTARTSYSLAGAVYEVYSDASCQTKVAAITVDSNGSGSASDLTPGTYYVKETKAPTSNAFSMDTKTHTVTVSEGQTTTLNTSDTYLTGSVSIQKTTDTTILEKEYPLTGAKYGIFTDSACTSSQAVITVDASGKGSASNIPFGTYYVKETQGPSCGMYQLDTKVYQISVTPSAKSITVSSADKLTRGKITVTKTAQARANGKTDIKGVQFTLSYQDTSKNIASVTMTTNDQGVASADGLLPGKWILHEKESSVSSYYQVAADKTVDLTKRAANGSLSGTVTINNQLVTQKVRIVKTEKDAGTPVQGAVFKIVDEGGKNVKLTMSGQSQASDQFTTPASGIITFTTALPGGEYKLYEIQAPAAYRIPQSLQNGIAFSINRTTVAKESEIEISAVNEVKQGRICIEKQDASNAAAKITGTYRFRISAGENIVDQSGKVRVWNKITLKKGTVVEEIKTGNDGKAYSSMLYPGKYIVTEIGIDRKEGLSLNDTPVEVTIRPEQIAATVTGNESAQQQSAVTLQVANQPVRLEVLKKDALTEQPLEGIRYCLSYAEDAAGGESMRKQEDAAGENDQTTGSTPPSLPAYKEAVTDQNGMASFDHLEAGREYVLWEKETLPGYNLDPTLYPAQVDANGRINGADHLEMTFENMPNRLDLCKIDIVAGEGGDELPGAAMELWQGETLLDSWISGETPHRMTGLAEGEYTLVERAAPELYEEAEKVTFTVTDSMEVQKVIMYDAHYQDVEISKKAITGEDELPGATLTVYRKKAAEEGE